MSDVDSRKHDGIHKEIAFDRSFFLASTLGFFRRHQGKPHKKISSRTAFMPPLVECLPKTKKNKPQYSAAVAPLLSYPYQAESCAVLTPSTLLLFLQLFFAFLCYHTRNDLVPTEHQDTLPFFTAIFIFCRNLTKKSHKIKLGARRNAEQCISHTKKKTHTHTHKHAHTPASVRMTKASSPPSHTRADRTTCSIWPRDPERVEACSSGPSWSG